MAFKLGIQFRGAGRSLRGRFLPRREAPLLYRWIADRYQRDFYVVQDTAEAGDQDKGQGRIKDRATKSRARSFQACKKQAVGLICTGRCFPVSCNCNHNPDCTGRDETRTQLNICKPPASKEWEHCCVLWLVGRMFAPILSHFFLFVSALGTRMGAISQISERESWLSGERSTQSTSVSTTCQRKEPGGEGWDSAGAVPVTRY